MDAQESEEASKGGISLLVVFIFTFLLLAFGIIIGITIKLFAQCAMNLVDKDDEPHGEDTLVEAPEKDSDEEENDAASATSSVWTESESEDEISRDCPPSYEESVASPPYAQGPIADTGVSWKLCHESDCSYIQVFIGLFSSLPQGEFVTSNHVF